MEIANLTKFGKTSANAITQKNDEVNSVAVQDKPKSLLDLSYSHKTTFNAGDVVPVFQLEAYPGDSFEVDVSAMIRMSIPSAPVMDSPRYDFNLFFIPYKQVWNNFPNLIGETYNGGAPVVVNSVPLINFDGGNCTYGVNDLASHMEIPQNVNMSMTGISISALPFRAYVKVWNEWFRDENLQSVADFSNQNEPDNNVTASNYWNNDAFLSCQVGKNLLKSNRLKDYFSSCLPFIQKGDPATIDVLDPQEIQAIFNDTYSGHISIENGGSIYSPFNLYVSDSGELYNASNPSTLQLTPNSSSVSGNMEFNSGTTFNQAYFNAQTVNTNSLEYTGPGASSFNITDLRNAIVLQHQRELDARAGTRYYEKLLSYWGVTVDPLSIDRTLYLGGYHDSININNVVQSAPSTSQSINSPLGSLGGLSVTATRSPNVFKFGTDQYGLILGLITVRTNMTYSQGLPRLFTTVNNFDFYNPNFEGISEQPIYKYELYLSENSNDNLAIFGYNQPFAHLKYKPNVASGYLSANAIDTYYQLYSYQNNLGSSPTLTNDWMYYPRTALENTLLLDSNNKAELINDFMADFYFMVHCSRTIPAYSVPGVDKV